VTTATPEGAREHARRQASTVVATMPTLPPAVATDRPEGIAPEQMVWAETVTGGGYTSLHLARGATLRLVDVDGDACAHLLAYNAAQTTERLNLADTVKVQWQAYPSAGSLLLSDLGRALATITADSSGRHDTMCGTTTRAGNTARYGDGAPQGPAPAGRELFTLAAAKVGLDRRDIAPSISFFQGVRVRHDGSTEFVGSAGPGRAVDIVAELPLLVLIANTTHPLDPRPVWSCGALRVLAWHGDPAPVAQRTPEAERALLNTAAYLGMRETVVEPAPAHRGRRSCGPVSCSPSSTPRGTRRSTA
jgi:urea carboxylase-associated protein 2